MRQVITHAGMFHADEVVAIAILKSIYDDIVVTRTNKPTEEQLFDTDILVLDIGGDYNKDSNNYDHHQDANLEASVSLIFDEYFMRLCDNYRLSIEDRYSFHRIVKHNFINYISDVDRGIKLEENRTVPTISTIIRNLNGLENGFEIALSIAENILLGVFDTAISTIKGESEWDNTVVISDTVRFQENDVFIPNWKELAIRDGVFMLIQENTRGGFQVTSRSTNELVLPYRTNQSFLHNSGFMCVFALKEEAIEYAISVSKTHIKK